MQKLVEHTKQLFDEKGEVTFGGWSKEPLFEYNKNDALNPNKIWEHDCYYIANDHIGLYLAVETCGMELSIKIVLANFRHKKVFGDYVGRKFILSPQKLPQAGTLGEFSYSDKRIAITLTNTVEGRYIKCDFIDFNNIKNLYIKLLVRKVAGESLNIVEPFTDSPKNFYFKRFVPKFVASGDIKYGGTLYKVTENNSYVYFDWSRYYLPKKTEYQVLSSAFNIDGHKFALNFASPIGDNKKGSENCFFLDGKLYKLQRFKVKGNPNNLQSSYYFLGNNGTDLVFTPTYYNDEAMICKYPKTTVVFGYLNGVIYHNDTDEIKLSNKPAHMIFSTI